MFKKLKARLKNFWIRAIASSPGQYYALMNGCMYAYEMGASDAQTGLKDLDCLTTAVELNAYALGYEETKQVLTKW